MNSTTLLIVFGVLLVVILVIGTVLKGRLLVPAAEGGAPNLYELRPAILSPAERSFAGVLDGCLPDGVTWVAKVRLGDVVVTKKGLAAGQRTAAWNRVNQKHLDFLLVRAGDFAPLAGIELDDKSHEATDRRKRDAFVDDVCRACSLPVLHVPAQAAYNPVDLRAKIAAWVGTAVAV